MLSLPDDWDYSLKGLTTGCRDGIDSVRSAVHELEDGGYLCRSKVRDARGRIIDYNYEVFELPQKERIEKRPAPVPNSPSSENPMSGFPTLENPTQQNTNKQNTKRQSTNLSGQTDESADFDQMEAQVREEFRERLEIDTLAQRYDPDKLEELLDNIVEMYCCPRQTQYVGKQPHLRCDVQHDPAHQEHHGLSAHHHPERPHHDGALLSGAGQLADRTESEEVSAVFHKGHNTR